MNLDIGNRTKAIIIKNKLTSNPSIAIIWEIFSVVKKSDIKKMFNEPRAPQPIAMVSKLKVEERSSEVELM